MASGIGQFRFALAFVVIVDQDKVFAHTTQEFWVLVHEQFQNIDAVFGWIVVVFVVVVVVGVVESHVISPSLVAAVAVIVNTTWRLFTRCARAWANG